MAWSSSHRKQRFNADWKRTREIVGRRDGWRCQWPVTDWSTGETRRCLKPGHEVDHKQRSLNGVDDDSLWNLWVLCPYHHAQKTTRESGEQRRLNAEDRRRSEWYSHPAFRVG